MKPRPILLLAVCLLVGAYELYALLTPMDGDTISEIIWRIAKGYPILPFAFGVLMGHFFWQENK
jgi:hypothetical protein